MVLGMKNWNIIEGSLKNPIFRGGEVTKNQYIGRRNYLKKEGLDSLQI